MSNEISKFQATKSGRILTGLAARKAAALEQSGEPEVISPTQMEYRIGIVFDDSGSMGRTIADAHEGCEEFLRSCEKDKTAVAVYPMNAEKLLLCSNLPAVAIMVKQIRASGNTPLIATAARMLKENNLTRAIVFSDGMPDTRSGYGSLLKYKIPIDTVYIADGACENEFLRQLAADTGGIYLHFQRGLSNFRTAFKYLSPGLRYMLADKSFTDKIQGR
jgi:hypothetical protein